MRLFGSTIDLGGLMARVGNAFILAYPVIIDGNVRLADHLGMLLGDPSSMTVVTEFRAATAQRRVARAASQRRGGYITMAYASVLPHDRNGNVIGETTLRAWLVTRATADWAGAKGRAKAAAYVAAYDAEFSAKG